MKKSIFLFFAAILCAMTANAAKERVYFVNTPGWTKVNVHAWGGTAAGTNWPGTTATKDTWQWNGKDVYYLEAEAGAYGQCIFNNGSNQQSADLTWTANSVYAHEAGKWTPVEIAKATTNGTKVYFVNAEKWTTVKVYAFSYSPKDTKNANWPGANATKESDKVGEYDVYSFTMNKEYDYCIFNNGASSNTKQTADLVVMDGADKYYCKDNWYTKEGAAEKVGAPIEYETVYFVNAEDWTGTISAYAYTPVQNAAWPGEPAAKEDYQIGGKNVYSYTAEKGKYKNVIFSGTGGQTADLTWTDGAGKYYVRDNWYTKEEAEAALAAPVVTYDYYVIGTVNGWALKDASYGMTDDNADGVYEKEVALAIGKHELKINNGTWDNTNTFGHDNLSVAYEGVSRGSGEGDNNIVIDLAEAKTINVKLDKNTKKITLDGLTEKAPEPTFDYYIVGSFNGNNPKKAENGMTLDGTVYKATVTLAAGDNTLKVTKGSWDPTWGYTELGAAYEEVSNPNDYNNIKITLAAEKEITVIFDATAGKITFEGLTPYVAPLTYTVTVPAGTEKCYIAGNMNGWAFQEMEAVTGETNKFTITIVGAKETDEYKYACQADWAYAEVIDGGGNRTQWTALDNVTAWNKPAVITYQLKGVGGWDQPGIELVQNPGNDKEYMLTCQAISATDAIKVVRLENGEIKDYYGNGTVKDDVTVAVSYDGEANIKLPAGKYNFYFDTAESEKKLWIAAATDCQTVTEITLTEGDNSSALATEGVVTVTVDRDFEKDNLYTIALPFTINNAASVFGNGTVVYNFANLAYDKTNEEYILGFTKVSKIEAGKPYLIEPGQNVNGFVAENVTLSSATSISQKVKVDNVEKTATMTAVLSETTTGGSYWLAEDRYLYNGEVNMPALRALFVLPTTPSGMPARARVALKEDAATGVEDLFTTDAPVKVIVNGQLIIIRDGEMYNVQGQLVK